MDRKTNKNWQNISMNRKTPTISIIIPVKNEGKNIASVINQLQKSISIPFETLIIYDDPSDTTKPMAERIIKEKAIRNFFVIQNNQGDKNGVINAIKTGIKHAKGNAVVITMADLSDDITQIPTMYKLLEQGYDIVCASRYMPGGEKIGGPFLKTFLSKAAGMTLQKLYSVPTHDATNAYKMYKNTLLKNITIESKGGFEYSLEIVLKAHKGGYKITEIPTVWKDRVDGKSNFKLWKWLPQYIKTYSIIFRK
ncbi:MAG: glycosyltransferase [Candidatus Levyibacteriota bacterium]